MELMVILICYFSVQMYMDTVTPHSNHCSLTALKRGCNVCPFGEIWRIREKISKFLLVVFLEIWARLFKTNDVVSERFVKNFKR